VELPFSVKAGDKTPARVVIAGSDTSKPDKRLYRYRARSDGKLVATGMVAATIAETVAFKDAPVLKEDGTLRIDLANSAAEKAYLLKSTKWRIGDRNGESVVGKELPACGELSLSLPAPELPAFRILPLRIEAELEGRAPLLYEGIVVSNRCASKTVTVDGKLDDWEKLPGVDLASHGTVKMAKYEGEDDLSGKVWFAWDDRNFYLAARIKDNEFSRKLAGPNVWKGDSIQFALVPGHPRGDWFKGGELLTWHEFSLALTMNGPEVYRQIGPGGKGVGLLKAARLEVKQEGKETTYEASIPWKELAPIAPKDKAFSISILVNDDDGKGCKGWIEWGAGIGAGKNPSRFLPCRFVKE